MTQEAEVFWRDYEASTGERVEARAMGEWLGPNAPKEGVWGLLILTDRSFHFLGQKSDKWVHSLLRFRGGSEVPPVRIDIPRESLTALVAPKRTGLARLLGAGFPEFSVSWTLPEKAGAGRAVFSVDGQQGFLEALRKALPPAASAEGSS